MISISAPRAIAACGILWAAAGLALLRKALLLGLELSQAPHHGAVATSSIYTFFERFLGSHAALLLLVAAAVALGVAKAKAVLAKSAQVNVARLRRHSQVPLVQIFSAKLWIVMAAMMALAAWMRKSAFALDGRLLVDLAVGSALIVASKEYFRGYHRLQRPICDRD